MFGPAETQTLKVIGDEAVNQLYVYLEEFLLGSYKMKDIFAWKKNCAANPEKSELSSVKKQELCKSLSEDTSGMKKAINRDRDFCNASKRKLHEIALEIYPEIPNLQPNQLKNFKYIFDREIINMSEKLDKLTFEHHKSTLPNNKSRNALYLTTATQPGNVSPSERNST